MPDWVMTMSLNSGLPEMLSDRMFSDPDDKVTGESVVTGGLDLTAPDVPWPYSLTDYLHRHIGKTVRAGCAISGGKYREITGMLVITGTNFIGVQPEHDDDLLVIETSALKFVKIAGFKG